VCDRNTLTAAGGLPQLLTDDGFILTWTEFDNMVSADMASLERIEKEAQGSDSLIGVGCGSVNDLCKLAAFRLGLPYAVFATAPSMDGFVSKDSAVIHDGFKGSYEARPPRLVLGDTDVLAQAPVRLKAAGFADLLGKYTALADWEICHIVTGEYFCPRIAALTREGVDRAVSLADRIALPSAEAAGALMEALVLSGIAMYYSGNSRPASGAEHHLSHFWEMLSLQKGEIPDLHGRKVGVAALMITRYYKELAGRERIFPEYRPMPEAKIREVFGSIAPGVLTENTPDPLGEIDPARFAQSWPMIRKIIAALPEESELARLLSLSGGAVRPEQVHVSEALTEKGLLFGRYTRRRLTLLRLSDLLIGKG